MTVNFTRSTNERRTFEPHPIRETVARQRRIGKVDGALALIARITPQMIVSATSRIAASRL